MVVGEGLVWLIGAVVCVALPHQWIGNGGSCQSTAISYDCTGRLDAALPRNSAIEESDLYLLYLCSGCTKLRKLSLNGSDKMEHVSFL